MILYKYQKNFTCWFVSTGIKLPEMFNECLIAIKKRGCFNLSNCLILSSRDDKIRTCDNTPPRRGLYRAELHPEMRMQM